MVGSTYQKILVISFLLESIGQAHTLTVPVIELSFPPIHVIRLDISEKKVPYIILYMSISPFNKLQATCGHGVIIYDIYTLVSFSF